MIKVAVLDDWQGIAEGIADWAPVRAKAEVTFFRDALTGEAVITALADYDVILAMRERTRLSKDVIDRLPKLRLLSFTGARNAAVDIPACTARGVTVCNTVPKGGYSYDTSELALGLLLTAARHIVTGHDEIHTGRFQERVKLGLGMDGATLGVIGLGRLGGRMAQYGLALGMTVLAWSQNLTTDRANEIGAKLVGKDELLARSDAISLHLVLSDRSRGTIGAADIAKMKPGAILINTSRGPLVDQSALVAALHAGRITAALDTYDEEPLPADHPLRTAPNTVLTPHLGYVTERNMAELYVASIANIAAWLNESPINVVNPPPA
jgi:phosphoglycerate dehydrogenase-like enzyme